MLLALRLISSNSHMDQFVTAERKFPLTLSLRRKHFPALVQSVVLLDTDRTEPARAKAGTSFN